MRAIEKQVLIHLFTKELAMALLDDKQTKKVFLATSSIVLIMHMHGQRICVSFIVVMALK